jgi:hypothetical protein
MWYTIAWGVMIVQVNSEGHVLIAYSGLPIQLMPFVADGI